MAATTDLTAEEIQRNFDKFQVLLQKVGDRADAAQRIVEGLGERLAIAPASTKLSFHNAFPGGLVEHSLRVFKNAFKLTKAFGWEIPQDSLIIATLFHDLGKVGDEKNDYYLPQESEWHREKRGEVFMINQELVYMTVPDRSVWLCQHYGLSLTKDEFLAIKLNDGQFADENKPYRRGEPALATIVHTADFIAMKQEKGLLE